VAFRKRAHGTAEPAYGVPLAPAEPVRLPLPVAVLISEHTVSAGETAATAFRTLPNATLIGQSTQGALSDVLEKALPNGWRFTLSNEIFETVDGSVPEGAGIKPNIETRAPAAPRTPRERFQPDIDEAVRALASR
jgi:C-terminal processing protease CtpA/Prc